MERDLEIISKSVSESDFKNIKDGLEIAETGNLMVPTVIIWCALEDGVASYFYGTEDLESIDDRMHGGSLMNNAIAKAGENDRLVKVLHAIKNELCGETEGEEMLTTIASKVLDDGTLIARMVHLIAEFCEASQVKPEGWSGF